MATLTARRILRVSARAFVAPPRAIAASHPGGANGIDGKGGNPVTIFSYDSSESVLTSEERVKLAQSCQWESIVIEPSAASASRGDDPRSMFRFYMPSGEEVSFCGHAAIGACAFLANKNTIISQQQSDSSSSSGINLSSLGFGSSSSKISFVTADGSKFETKVKGNEAELIMQTHHTETKCISGESLDKPASMEDFLDEIGLDILDVAAPDNTINLPTFINSSVARPKTLIPIKSMNRLHAATAPKDPAKFHRMCDSIDSTGIYIYSAIPDNSVDATDCGEEGLAFEARQFPKSSGYAEDPATGIAAGALAASLYRQGLSSRNEKNGSSVFTVFQGTSMGQPSRIGVNIHEYNLDNSQTKDEAKDVDLNISYAGLVSFDSLSFSRLE